MPENPYQSPQQTDPRPATEPDTLWRAIQRGAWLGIKWVTYLMAPLAALAVAGILLLQARLYFQAPPGTDLRQGAIGALFLKALLGPLMLLAIAYLWSLVLTVPISAIAYLMKSRHS